MLVAYIQNQLSMSFLEEQLEAINPYNYQILYIDKGKKQQQPFTIIEQMQPHDTFLVYQLACLGMSLRTLAIFLKEIRRRQLSFISIQDQLQLDSTQENPLFLHHLDLLIETEKRVQSKRTIDSLEELKREGKSYGRPAITQKKIDKILRLHDRHYSYRKIAMICEISVGSVHKYIKKEIEKRGESEGEK